MLHQFLDWIRTLEPHTVLLGIVLAGVIVLMLALIYQLYEELGMPGWIIIPVLFTAAIIVYLMTGGGK
jgi:hypothetical protein